MAELSTALEDMDAPLALQEWTGAQEKARDAWARCDVPEWLFWIAGAAGASLNDALLVAIAWGAEVAERVPECATLAQETLDAAQACALGEIGGEECLQAAANADAAATSAPATFRDAAPLGFQPLARACGWLARAAEGLLASRRRAEAVRMQRALHAASYLGTGVDTLVEREAPIRLVASQLQDPLQAELLYVVAALAEAAKHLTAVGHALAPEADPSSLSAKSAHLVRALFEQVEA